MQPYVFFYSSLCRLNFFVDEFIPSSHPHPPPVACIFCQRVFYSVCFYLCRRRCCCCESLLLLVIEERLLPCRRRCRQIVNFFPRIDFCFLLKDWDKLFCAKIIIFFCETPLSSWMISFPRKCEYEILQKTWIPWKMLVTLLILRSDHRILANRVTLDYEIPLYGLNTA